MRMEELSENRYLKTTDTVEKYLVNLVEEYFKKTSFTAPGTKEYVINQAVKRLKEEVDFDALGVLSIQLPDDEEPRTGAVDISIENLHGEPVIDDKRSAFNVNFGVTAQTACEGNDPRLSDARTPLPHEHDIGDIEGLSGSISTIRGNIASLSNFHTHGNTDILDRLVYSGSRSHVDLADVEKINTLINSKAEQINNEIATYQNVNNNKISEINTKISQIENTLSTIGSQIVSTNETELNTLESYVNEKMSDIATRVDEALNECVTFTQLMEMLDVANYSYILAGEITVPLQSFFDVENFSLIDGQQAETVTYTADIPQAILDVLAENEQTLPYCRIEPVIEYQGYVQPLPYVFIKDGDENGFISASVNTSQNKYSITVSSADKTIDDTVIASTIVIKIFCAQKVTYVSS